MLNHVLTIIQDELCIVNEKLTVYTRYYQKLNNRIERWMNLGSIQLLVDCKWFIQNDHQKWIMYKYGLCTAVWLHTSTQTMVTIIKYYYYNWWIQMIKSYMNNIHEIKSAGNRTDENVTFFYREIVKLFIYGYYFLCTYSTCQNFKAVRL